MRGAGILPQAPPGDRRPASAADLYDRAADHPARNILVKNFRQPVEFNRAGTNDIQVCGFQIGREPVPHFQAKVPGRRHRVDAKQTDTPQDKRHYGRV